MIRILLLLALVVGLEVLVPPAAHAQPKNQCTPNGCGPDGWLGTAVPDRLLGCSFHKACNEHDICYSRCQPCGALFGRPECEGTCEQKRERKDRCDTAFHERMLSDNSGRARCANPARAYYLAVKFRGCSYFRSLREALRTREQFQQDFEAILKWLDENPDQQTQESAGLVLHRVSTLDASERNRLATDGARLAIVAEGSAKPGLRSSTTGRPARWLLNGVDVSGMVINGQPFDLEAVTKERKDFDARGLGQQVIPTR